MTERPLDVLNGRPTLESTPRQRAEAFYARSVEAAQFSREVVIPQIQGLLRPSPRERAAILVFGRMHAWAESLALLDHAKHYQAAAAGARALFELFVDLLLLVADTDGKDIERFLCLPDVEKFRVAEKVARFRQEHSDFDIVDPTHLAAFVAAPGKAAEVDAIRLRLWGPDRKGRPQAKLHWSGLDMAGRTTRLGPRIESHYYELYSQLSWHVHSGPVGTEGRPLEDFDNLCGLAHAYSQEFFLESLATVGKQLRLPDAYPGFFAALNRLREIPGVALLRSQGDPA